MSDKSTGQLKVFAIALILLGTVALPLVRGFQTDFAPAAEVIDNVPHPVPHAKATPTKSPEHAKAKPTRSPEHDKQKRGKSKHGGDDD